MPGLKLGFLLLNLIAYTHTHTPLLLPVLTRQSADLSITTAVIGETEAENSKKDVSRQESHFKIQAFSRGQDALCSTTVLSPLP